MPIQNNPPRQIGTSIQRSQNDQYAVERGGGAFNGITEETITATNSDGSYAVANTWLTTSGVSQPINVGDIVKVGWHGGKPVVILSHTARRAKFVPPPPVGGPIVEMLLAAPTGPVTITTVVEKLDIYFRNANQLTLLNCRAQIEAAGFTILNTSLGLTPNSWGQDRRHFLVSFTNGTNNHPCIAIFHLTGSSTTAITGTAQAKLDSVLDLATINISLGSISWDQNVPGGGHVTTAINMGTALSTGYSISVPTDPFHLIVQDCFATVTSAFYTKTKQLILAVTVKIGDTFAGGQSPPSTTFYYPFIINATANALLFNGFTYSNPGPVYPGNAFVNVGPGLFDTTGTGTNAWTGGSQFILAPSKNGNFMRVIAGFRNLYFGGNPVLGGHIEQQLSIKDLTAGVTGVVFPLTDYAPTDPFSGNRTGFTVLSADHRYVMWGRWGPAPANTASAFTFPISSTLTGYDFSDGLHIADMGSGEDVLVADYVVLTSLANIETFLDSVPYLTSTALMWEDHNDLRVPENPNSTVPSGRIAPEFVTFRHVNTSTGDPQPITPFVLPLNRFGSIRQAVSVLKPIPTTKNYITDMVNILYINSGHADMVSGYSIFASPYGAFAQIQVIPGSGVVLPNR